MKVLVVDDHPDSAHIACMLLTALGHECCEATTGSDALRAAELFRPEMAILDIGMPDLSGYEVARTLRTRFGPSIYLVALTGWGQPEDRARALAAGFDEHVLKPADATVFRHIIRHSEHAHVQS